MLKAYDPDAVYDQRRSLALLDKPYPLEDRLLESKMLAIFEGDPPEHILSVDDDERIQTMIYSILVTEFGYQVTLASNGQEAVDLIRDGLAPDLVLMDLQMPVMDGQSAIRCLKLDPRTTHIPIIAMSAINTLYEQRDDLLVANAALDKPFYIQELVLAVQMQLANRRLAEHIHE